MLSRRISLSNVFQLTDLKLSYSLDDLKCFGLGLYDIMNIGDIYNIEESEIRMEELTDW